MYILYQVDLVTLNIIYYRLDYQGILQEFIWQFEDRVPEIPKVHRFLNYWKDNIEAKIQQVLIYNSIGKQIGYRTTI